ncbi:MAG: NAD(+)/NADH kinase [Desulfovibrio sp.]|nr:NAD(+)/NADH kinase [Desulfovibrio sp.]
MDINVTGSILIVAKARVAAASELAEEIARWLREQGRKASVLVAGVDSPLYSDPSLGLIIVLGGDGTILGCARKVVGRRVPLVCINFGRVGFLSDIEPEQWREGLAEVLASRHMRAMSALRWKLMRYGHDVAHGYAVNDVVLSHGALARLVLADIYIDGELMGTVRADGFLLSTPMGSSGYSVSAAGPLLSPTVGGVAFVPICPFLNTIPPMVFPCGTVFRFELKPGTTESCVTLDGQDGQDMQTHDVLEVESVPDCVFLLGKGLSFIERLRTRSFILQNPIRRGENAPSGL